MSQRLPNQSPHRAPVIRVRHSATPLYKSQTPKDEQSHNTFENGVGELSLSDAFSKSSKKSTTTWSEDSDESTISTPPSELQESIADLDTYAPSIVNRNTKRRASTSLIASSAEDIQKLLGDGTTGTKFLQKYCCGGGCCMVQRIPINTSRPGLLDINVPNNDAFSALKLKLGGLTLETPLTNLVDLHPTTVTLETLSKTDPTILERRISSDIHPPDFVQPHPPYAVFSAPLFHARELTNPGAEKRTYHFDLDITDYPEEGGVDFKVGGAVGICPPNDREEVDQVFDLLGIPRYLREKPVRLRTTSGRWPTIWGEEEGRELLTTRRELLTWCSDISSMAPTKALIRLFAEYASAEHEKKILSFLCSAQGQAAFCDLRTGPFVTLSQLLLAFPSSKPPLEKLFSVLPQLMPRFYSLSNDPFESFSRGSHSGRKLIETAVTIHEIPDWTGRHRLGLGSGFLERMAQRFTSNPSEPLRIPMFRGLMANPLSREFNSDGPMMLIGAGVGMAPFRGFILNRLRNANCANKIWLVQGVRDSMLDELYAGELGHHEKEIKKVVQSRVSNLDVRPPPVSEFDDGVIDEQHTEEGKGAIVVSEEKKAIVGKYVQDEVRLQADIVWFVINAVDGRVFVCGSTKGMGEGVEEALVDVAMEKGGLNREESKRFWEEKKAGGQYIAVSRFC